MELDVWTSSVVTNASQNATTGKWDVTVKRDDGTERLFHVDHVVFGLTAALPALRRAGGGTIVATSSLAGLVAMPGDAIYTMTKHAVVGYVRSAAATLDAEGIRYVRCECLIVRFVATKRLALNAADDGTMNKAQRELALDAIKKENGRTRVILISFKAGSTGERTPFC